MSKKGRLLIAIIKIIASLRCKCKSSCCSCDTTMNEEKEEDPKDPSDIMEDIEKKFI